jgi:hypothetical protein
MGSLRTLRAADRDYLINDFEYNLKKFMDKLQAQYPTARISAASYDGGRIREVFVVEENCDRNDLVANYMINAESWNVEAYGADSNVTYLNLGDAVHG